MVVGEILTWLAQTALTIVETLGYAGVFFLMVLESMVFPVPSEAVLPPAGWLAAEGRMSFWLAFLAATAGTIVGSLLSYAMGLWGVRPFLERYGRWFLVTPHHLDLTHAFFERRSAAVAIFVSRFVPVVRHLISIPAGSARMPLVPFVVATALGGGAWNLILLYAGFVLGENWHAIEPIVSEYRTVMLLLLLVLGLAVAAWLVARRMRTREAPR